MAGSENSGKAVFRLKLLVDKKKNKVVLAEAGKEFVDVLFSFLTLQMGTVVRLMEKYQKEVHEATKLGCFNNLYKSVFDIGTADFMTKACMNMLLYPRTVIKNQHLKINIDDTETLKYYMCPRRCSSRLYSNFCSSKCFCGSMLSMQVTCDGRATEKEAFVSHKNLFTITDNLKVGFTSTSHTLKTLKVLGYYGIDKLNEIHVDVDHDKVVALFQCLYSSDTPLTDVFLTKNRTRIVPNLAVQEDSGGVSQSNKVLSVSVFTRKLDNKFLYIESAEDFVDLLFTFLVLPLNYAWKLAGSHLGLGCVDNLCESFKTLNSSDVRNAYLNMLPWYYKCQKPLLYVCYEGSRDVTTTVNSCYSNPIFLKPIDPTCDKLPNAGVCSGFVKRGTTFMVSDDLTITPMDLSSTICLLKKWNMGLDDLEEQVIKISRAEAIRILRASFLTSNALTTVFKSLLFKKPKKEKV